MIFFRAHVIQPGKSIVLPQGRSFYLQNASLERRVEAPDERTALVLSFSPASEGLDSATICVLTPNKVGVSILPYDIDDLTSPGGANFAIHGSRLSAKLYYHRQWSEVSVGVINSSASNLLNPRSPVSIIGSCSERFELNLAELPKTSAPATLKRPTNKQDAPPRPTKVPRTDANASSLRKTGLQSATQLVINGSKVSGLYALRLSGAKSWLCSEFQVSQLPSPVTCTLCIS